MNKETAKRAAELTAAASKLEAQIKSLNSLDTISISGSNSLSYRRRGYVNVYGEGRKEPSETEKTIAEQLRAAIENVLLNELGRIEAELAAL